METLLNLNIGETISKFVSEMSFVEVFQSGQWIMIVVACVFLYLAIANLFSFFAFGLDKYKAKKHAWRISERFLLLTAAIGGSAGALFGMRIFHHKTLHRKFTVGVPLILFVQLGLILFYWIHTDPRLFSFLF